MKDIQKKIQKILEENPNINYKGISLPKVYKDRETKTQKFCDKGGFFEGCVMEGIEYHKESK